MGMMTASLYITGVNILLLSSLLVVYVRNLRQVGSTFTLGLLLFATLLLIQNAVSFYFYATMMPYFAAGLEGYVLTFNALQLCAFVILNYLTWK